MRVFGFDADDVRQSVATIAPLADSTSSIASDAHIDDAAKERFARAVWTTLAEPGDGTAGFLTSALGASRSLDALIEGRSAAQIVDELNIHGYVERVDGLVDDIQKALTRWLPRLDSTSALTAVRTAAHCGATILIPGDASWPDQLNDLDSHAPLGLWVRGDTARLRSADRSISLVGARAATGYGEHVTIEAASSLVGRGFAIVSGAAYGIDGAAHRATLASNGTTFAFLAGGVDRPYPSGHDSLIGRIIDTGAVLSEVPCGTSPTKWRFLQRNRLIAALSQATVVLEAGWRSGSLNTAGHAAALGRALGAVPGSVMSAASAGCHRLIREYGATCVTNADEMAELVQGGLDDLDRGNGRVPGVANLTPEETRVLDALSTGKGRTVDDIARRSGLPNSVVQAALGVLQIYEAADERSHGWVCVPRKR
ncbi:DNA-processing protein DprA [Mycetocola zhadangensis]|uniref:DNA-processing protein DprA n=1 Tax=Mycetocola zhadangensis TaxID=1164595 RepID=UPI003A4D9FF1